MNASEVQVYEGDGIDRRPRKGPVNRFPPRGDLCIDSTNHGEIADVLVDKVQQNEINVYFGGDACFSDAAKALEEYERKTIDTASTPMQYKFALSFLFEGRKRVAYGCFVLKRDLKMEVNGNHRLCFTLNCDKVVAGD